MFESIVGFTLGYHTSLFIAPAKGVKPPDPPEFEQGWILAEKGKTNYTGIWEDAGIWIDNNVWYD